MYGIQWRFEVDLKFARLTVPAFEVVHVKIQCLLTVAKSIAALYLSQYG